MCLLCCYIEYIIINANISTFLHSIWFCCHGNTQHPAPLTFTPCILNHSWFIFLFTTLYPNFFNWKDKLNVECFIQDLLFINYHQICELVSMATEFFRVHGISERKNTIFKQGVIQNIFKNYISKY